MPAVMKKPPTERDIKVFIKDKELSLPKDERQAIATILKGVFNQKTYSGAEVFGKEINDSSHRIAKYLKGHRLKSGLSQIEVTKKTGIKQSNLSAFENARGPLSKLAARKLSKLLNCNIDILLGNK